MVRIDAHQHNWNPAQGDHHLMPPRGPILARTHAPSDLEPELKACGVEATVPVQAAATVCGSEYLFGIADATPGVAGVVGWMNFKEHTDRRTLERLGGHPKFVGVRPMIQGVSDLSRLLCDDLQLGNRAIDESDQSSVANGFPRHLKNFLTVLD